VVVGQPQVLDVAEVADRPVYALVGPGAFGGVLGDVAGERGVGHLSGVGVLELAGRRLWDRPDVELGTPGQRQYGPVRAGRAQQGVSGCVAHRCT
jgi:hypothetical protein